MQKSLVAVFSFGTAPEVNRPLLTSGIRTASGKEAMPWLDHYFYETGLVEEGKGFLGGKLEGDRYVSLVRCAFALAEYVQHNRIYCVQVVCAPQCRLRLRRDLKRMLPKRIKLEFVRDVWEGSAWMYYHSASEYWRTRSSWQWWPYELVVFGVNLLSWKTYARKDGLTEHELYQVENWRL